MSCCARREFGSCLLCLYTRAHYRCSCARLPLFVFFLLFTALLAIRVQIEHREMDWMLEFVRATTAQEPRAAVPPGDGQ